MSDDISEMISACFRAKIRLPVANVVDHIIPHKLKDAIDSGDVARIEASRALFWDSANWQSLCAPCHNSIKQAEEKVKR